MFQRAIGLVMRARDKYRVDRCYRSYIGIDKRRSGRGCDQVPVTVFGYRCRVAIGDAETRNVSPPGILNGFNSDTKPAPKADRNKKVLRRHDPYFVLNCTAAADGSIGVETQTHERVSERTG